MTPRPPLLHEKPSSHETAGASSKHQNLTQKHFCHTKHEHFKFVKCTILTWTWRWVDRTRTCRHGPVGRRYGVQSCTRTCSKCCYIRIFKINDGLDTFYLRQTFIQHLVKKGSKPIVLILYKVTSYILKPLDNSYKNERRNVWFGAHSILTFPWMVINIINRVKNSDICSKEWEREMCVLLCPQTVWGIRHRVDDHSMRREGTLEDMPGQMKELAN